MRRSIAILGGLGIVLFAAAALWLFFAPGALVKYPDDLNKTAVANGTVTLYVDPATGAPATSPTSLPLTIKRNLRVTASDGSTATVQETSTEQIGSLAPEELLQRYVIDRGSLENLSDPQAYAYTESNVVDRSGAYSINLPFSTGDGPYRLWKNETSTMYAFSQAGDEIEREGLTLKPMTGRIVGAQATQAYIDQLAPQGIRSEMTFADLAPQLKAQGVDPALLTKLPAELSAADRKALEAMIGAPVEIKYVISANTRLLVEPTTGAIVSLDRIDQTMSALPDLSRFTGLGTMLAKPEYADSRVIQGALAALKGLSPEPVPVLRLQYGQTPESVADIAAYTEDKAMSIQLVELWIPIGLTIFGLTAAIAAFAVSRTRVKTAA